MSKAFLPWLDLANYTALSGGDFETGAAGWSLDGAAVTGGNGPYCVGGANDSRSLAIPAGGSAVSPTMCVGLTHPTIRFFAKRQSGGWLSLGRLRVDVLFETATGAVASLPIGAVGGASSWQVTSPMLVVVNLLALLPGERTRVAFRFTAEGGDFSVDDVWVDPHAKK